MSDCRQIEKRVGLSSFAVIASQASSVNPSLKIDRLLEKLFFSICRAARNSSLSLRQAFDGARPHLFVRRESRIQFPISAPAARWRASTFEPQPTRSPREYCRVCYRVSLQPHPHRMKTTLRKPYSARSANNRPASVIGPKSEYTYSPSKCNGSRLVTNIRVHFCCARLFRAERLLHRRADALHYLGRAMPASHRDDS